MISKPNLLETILIGDPNVKSSDHIEIKSMVSSIEQKALPEQR
jgi:hypothetical protein